MTAPTPKRQWEKEAWIEFMPPRPRIERRPLTAKDILHSKFPASPRRTWRKAREVASAEGAEVLQMTYAVGPLLDARLSKVLQEDVPTLALWVLGPAGRLRATWYRREAWSFWSAIISDRDGSNAQSVNHKEVMAWLSIEGSSDEQVA